MAMFYERADVQPFGVGLIVWATPRLAGKLFGLDAQANPQSPYLARLFGVRDLALAWGALGAQGSARRQWLLLPADGDFR